MKFLRQPGLTAWRSTSAGNCLKENLSLSTVEKECLAIQRAVDSLYCYLLGCPFTPCWDHAPLQWLHCMKDPNAQITWWYVALELFKFKVGPEMGAGGTDGHSWFPLPLVDVGAGKIGWLSCLSGEVGYVAGFGTWLGCRGGMVQWIQGQCQGRLANSWT